MERTNTAVEMKLEDKGFTYVFRDRDEMAASPSTVRRRLVQIFPSVCATLIALPFGIMLGWPSPTYPTLVGDASPVPISIDQSAMVAGFLMIGNTVATPVSSARIISAKNGIVVATMLVVAGWIVMWQAKDIFWLLGSRFLVGAGNGYGVGQLKIYIREMTQPPLTDTLVKQINLYAFFGVLVAFAYGPYVDFRRFSIVAMIISIFVMFLAVFLPLGPRELLKIGKVEDAKNSIAFLSPQADVKEELAKIKEQMNCPSSEMSFWSLMKDRELRRRFAVFAGLVFCQQFSGIPATIVYTQIIFEKGRSPRPELCALVYAFVYLLANVYGVVCSPGFRKKHLLLFSSVAVSLVLVVQVLVLVQRVNELYWAFTSVVVLIVFNIVHTVGLGSVPVTLIPEMFPKEASAVLVHFFVMFHSMLALTITKIFQVMMDRLGLFAPFCLFLTVSSMSIVYVIIFVPNKKKSNTEG